MCIAVDTRHEWNRIAAFLCRGLFRVRFFLFWRRLFPFIPVLAFVDGAQSRTTSFFSHRMDVCSINSLTLASSTRRSFSGINLLNSPIDVGTYVCVCVCGVRSALDATVRRS